MSTRDDLAAVKRLDELYLKAQSTNDPRDWSRYHAEQIEVRRRLGVPIATDPIERSEKRGRVA